MSIFVTAYASTESYENSKISYAAAIFDSDIGQMMTMRTANSPKLAAAAAISFLFDAKLHDW